MPFSVLVHSNLRRLPWQQCQHAPKPGQPDSRSEVVAGRSEVTDLKPQLRKKCKEWTRIGKEGQWASSEHASPSPRSGPGLSAGAPDTLGTKGQLHPSALSPARSQSLAHLPEGSSYLQPDSWSS